jgi:putative two-component system protein, hydrogenase maturation factor HypX/HoxX
MKVLLLSSSYNSLTQHAHVELQALGHEVSIELAVNQKNMIKAVSLFKPDLVLCPMLTHIIPNKLWQSTPCIIIHPGIKGDRGAASLDWAILNQQEVWGVTAVEASDEVDSGPIWATCNFKARFCSKSSLYRDELSNAAIKVIRTTVKRFENGTYVPEPLDYSRGDVKGCYQAFTKQTERAIDWERDRVDTILMKIHSADSNPGLLDEIYGEPLYLYGAHREGALVGPPGKILGRRHGAICRAAIDGAVWITHLKRQGKKEEGHFKLPAEMILEGKLNDVPFIPIDLLYKSAIETFKDIWYREQNQISYLYFEFYNGAMSTEQCQRLTSAFREASTRPNIKVIVLMGGRDFWSNGIHLNVIEASVDPAEESWENINAIDDLVEAIATPTNRLVISAMHGNAGAGGVMMALAADKVLARENLVLNPHYKGMGGLYGSEYWTYLLPKRVGQEKALELTEGMLPISVETAKKIGLVDDVIYQDESDESTFHNQVTRIAENMAHSADYELNLATKKEQMRKDNKAKPMSAYREEELAKMKNNFYGKKQSYHEARRAFVLKHAQTETPEHLAVHRK